MKARAGLVSLVAALALVGLVSQANAYHSGGVARCSGCHTMHNSFGNEPMTINTLSQGTGNAFLLKGSDQSSTCLNCHSSPTDTAPSSYHISSIYNVGTGPVERTPGGDFTWLTHDFTYTAHGETETSEGENHGHSINAADFGYVADATRATAPGGTYDATKLHCSSCHDPHGKYRILADGSVSNGTVSEGTKPIKMSGSTWSTSNASSPTADYAVGVYRLLAGHGYSAKSYTAYSFTNDPPVAISPSTYNRTEASTQTRVAYGSGMSDWCGNCHGEFHNSGELIHPAGENLDSEIAGNYDSYVKTGDLSGTHAIAYLSLVPFETGQTNSGRSDLATIANTSSTVGPAADSKVMCLTCHRAHASGWDSAARWNMGTDFIVYNSLYPGTDNGASTSYAQGRTAAEAQAAYYDRPVTVFANYQRSLCNKCHIKD